MNTATGTGTWRWRPRIAALAIAVVGVALMLAGSARVARGATGDQLRQITGATPACSVGTGIAFDGSRLILSCWGSNQLWRVSPANGALIDTMTISGVRDMGAMAWDGSRGKLWVCDAGASVALVDMTAKTGAAAFHSAGCVDGLAYDGSDDTIWSSSDAAHSIQHYTTDGKPLGSFSLSGKLGGECGNSGIAVGGDKLYLANNGCSQIYQCSKDLATCTVMSSFPKRLEDLECDSVTFAPKGAIWSIDAYDRILNAWEIPAGACTSGGGVGGPSAGPTPIAPKPVPTSCIPGIVESRCFSNPPTVVVTPTSAPPASPTVAPPAPTAVSTVLGAQATPRTGVVIAAPSTGSGPAGGGGTLGWAMLLAGVSSLAGASALALGLRRR